MVDSSELMLGNVVYRRVLVKEAPLGTNPYTWEPAHVVGIKPAHVSLRSPNSNIENISVDNLRPVPLSADALARMGFEIKERFSLSEHWTHKETDSFQRLYVDKEFKTFGVNTKPMRNPKYVHNRHLHQLQNAWCAATGATLLFPLMKLKPA